MDCFRAHPNYADEVRRQFNLQLHLISRSDILGSIATQVTGVPVTLIKLDPTLSDDILEANYALS